MDTNSVWTLSGAQTLLKSHSTQENILEKIKETIFSWNYKSEYDIESIKTDLFDIVEEAISKNFNTNDNDKMTEIKKSVACVVFNEIYENLIPLMRGQFSKEDLYLYEKCTFLCKQSVSPGDFGSSVYNCLPFVAAVVELSVLDTYKSPLEKINCLCSTYDLIFAELKLALVSIISKYSDRECEIPVINNEEVLPIVILVIIKSKLLYLWSNLFYINFFGSGILEENNNVRAILKVYESAVQKIMSMKESSLKPSCDKIPTNLDFAQTMAILSSEDTMQTNKTAADTKSSTTLGEERKKRLISLITTSTAEKNFIPLDVSKIFS